MKFNKILFPLISLAVIFTGCAKEEMESHLKDVKAEPSYLVIDAMGGNRTFTLTTSGAWNITNIPDWLEVNPKSGEAAPNGVEVTLSALKAYENLSVNLSVNVGAASQTVIVKQVLGGELEITSTEDFMKNGADGKTYLIQGIVSSISNTVYGNFYLNDGSYKDGKGVYIYGMLDANGGTKNFLSLGIEEGDEIIVTGARTTYNSVIEIVDASLVKIVKKALLAANQKEFTVEAAAGEVAIPITVKGDDVQVSSDAEADWIRYKSLSVADGKNKIIIEYDAYDGAVPRTAEVTAVSSKEIDDELQSSTIIFTIKQLPATPEVKLINEVNFGDKEYVHVEGQVIALTTDGFVLADQSGKVFIEGDSDYEIGSKVSVLGVSENKYARNKIVADQMKVLEEEGEYEYAEPVVLDAGNAESVIGTSPADYTYYKVNGFIVGGKLFFNETAAQTVTAISPLKKLDFKAFEGEYVEVYGFYTDNNFKYKEIQLVVTEIKEAEEAPSFIKTDKTSFYLDWNETSSSVSIVANKDWTATLKEGSANVTIDKTSGNGNAKVNVTFAGKNNTYEKQVATVIVSDGTANIEVRFTQDPKVFKFAESAIDVEADKESVSVAFEASAFWEATVTGGAALNKADGKGNDSFLVTFPKNTTGADKTYVITLKEARVQDEEPKTVTCTITHKG